MSLQGHIDKNVSITIDYQRIERNGFQVMKRNHKRRLKGKLYRISLTECAKNWEANFYSVKDFVVFALFKDASSGRWDNTIMIPEGELVMYLGATNKLWAKVLWGQRICQVMRAELTLEPISS